MFSKYACYLLDIIVRPSENAVFFLAVFYAFIIPIKYENNKDNRVFFEYIPIRARLLQIDVV